MRLLLVLVAVLSIGCRSGIAPETYCYQVTGATVHAVDTGMNVAGDLYRAGRLSAERKADLVAAHEVYRPAAQAAVAGCKAVGSRGDADKLVAQLRIAADKLIEALVQAGVIR